jgi:hypothetical protein
LSLLEMVQQYAWHKLDKADGSLNTSARSGHTLSSAGNSFICFGGLDGRKDTQGKTIPNNDLYMLSVNEGMYMCMFIDSQQQNRFIQLVATNRTWNKSVPSPSSPDESFSEHCRYK